MNGQKFAIPTFGQKQDEDQLRIKPAPVAFDPHESMRLAGAKDVGDEQLEEEGRDAAQREKRVRRLCCCGVPGCGIGPFTRTEEY